MPFQTDGQTNYPSVERPWCKYYNKILKAHYALSPDCSMETFLRLCNKDKQNLAALNYFGTRISYQSMFEWIDRVAAALQKTGVKKSDIITLCALNTPEFVYFLYAINKIGAVSNWVGLTSPVSDLREQLTSTKSKLVFVIDVAYEQIQEASQGTEVEKIITVSLGASMPKLLKFLYGLKKHEQNQNNTDWKSFICGAGDARPAVVEGTGDDLAVIEYTGGSTGVPKGVMLSNRNLNSYYINFLGANDLGYTIYKPGDRFLACVPLFLAFGVSTAGHGCLCHSQELILAPDPKPDALGKLIIKSKPNHIIAGRVQIDGFIKEACRAKKDLSFIKSVMYGGEATDKIWEQESQDALGRYGMKARILNGYGMTETSAAILFNPVCDTKGLLPFANVNIMITDPDDSQIEMGYDTEGELCLSSDTIMTGYFQNEAETEKVIFYKNGLRWLRTQDLAAISPEGRVRLTGRMKRIYHKLSSGKVGVRVYPMRIEECINEEPTVEKCAVVGVPDDETAYRTIAYIIPRKGNDHDSQLEELISKHCHEKLPESHIPDEYRFVSEFPLTRAGKIDYRALERDAGAK